MIVPDESPGRVIRDPVYGYIRLPDSLAPLVDHPLYQRLRRIAQTSLTSAVYPSATGTRFEHGLGAMHLARESWGAIGANSLRSVLDRFEAAINETVRLEPARAFELIRDALGGAALLHDLGHPPFSHVLEPAFRRLAFAWFDLPAARPEVLSKRQALIDQHIARSKIPFHEAAGWVLTQQVLEEAAGEMKSPLPALIRHISQAGSWDGSWGSALHGVIDAEIDIDRLDYLMRDGQRAGTEFGSIDWERLVSSLTMIEIDGQPGRFRILPKTSARSAVETLLLQRSQAYKWLIFHPRVIGTNLALAEAVDDLISASTGPRSGEPVALPGLAPPPPWLDLNYLDPRPEDLALRFGIEDDRVAAQLRDRLGTQLQAHCDDGRLLEHLKTEMIERGRDIHAPDESMSASAVLDSRRSLALLGAVLLRRKNFFAAWKTYEEFRAVVRSLVKDHDLANRIASVYERSANETDSQDRKEHLHERREAALSALSGEDIPVAAVNHYLKVSVSDPRQRSLLLDRLSDHPAILPEGFWKSSYVPFESVRETGILAELVDEDGVIQKVRDTWSVIQGLAAADKARVGFFLFYFATDDAASSVSARKPPLLRETLRGAFVETFPTFLEEQLAIALDAEVGAPA